MCAEARDRWLALGDLASVPQPEELVRELHGRLTAAATAAGVSPASAMDLATTGLLLRRDAANSFGVGSRTLWTCEGVECTGI